MTNQPRIPKSSDFSSSYTLSIIPPKRKPSNVTSALIILHGVGDSEVPFKQFAESLALPATVSIALRAPYPLPSMFVESGVPAFNWTDDLMYDEQTNTIDGDGGFVRAMSCLEDIILTLIRDCGFVERDILFFGFGQGSMASLGFVTKMEREGKAGRAGFGGVVAIGAGLPKECFCWKPNNPSEKLKTPVILCGGNSATMVTSVIVVCLKDRFTNVRYVKWNRPGDGMPSNREEILPIMEFFASRLRSRAGVPDGAIEL